ncbi:MAG: membrane protein insertase YidC [Planctomycetia bacterium]|nr:membrane protein insertase YidC [Planctomycetia bacterium]
MERRFVLALTLSIGVMFLWPMLFPTAKPPPKDPPPATAGNVPAAAANPAAANPAGANGQANPANGAANPAAAPAPARTQQADAKTFVMKPAKGEFLEVEATSRGGALRRVTLRNAYEYAPGDSHATTGRQHLDVILPVDDDLLTGGLAFDAADAEALRTTHWTVDRQTDTEVEFSFLTNDGLRVRKTITVPTDDDRFDLAVAVSLEQVEGTPTAGATRSLRLLGAAGLVKEPSNHVAMSSRSGVTGVQPVAYVVDVHDEPEWAEWSVPRVELNSVRRETRAFRLAGIASSYFLAAVYSEGDKRTGPLVDATWVDGGDARYRDTKAAFERLNAGMKARGRVPAEEGELVVRLEEAATVFHRAWVEFQAPVGAAGQAPASTFRVYAGPLSRRVLAADRYDALEGLIVFPAAPDFLARFLLFIFDLWKALTSSAGLAIILMTLTVRGGLMPLSIRNQLSMRAYGRKMTKLKPKLEAIKTRYGNNLKKYREEQQKLMREHNVKLPLGCLMMLLQIPIFFALFSSLRAEYEIRHQAFAWIRDLSGPDRLVDFGRDLISFLPFPPGGFRGINLLPIVYIVLTIWQQKLMPPPQDEQQAQQMKMAKWMSIIFSVLLYNYTGALALYMCVSSLVAVVESRIVRARDRHNLMAAAAADATG